MLYQAGAHDGFHEAIGDALALSVTPAYLSSSASSRRSRPTRRV
jgi:peptidyl-dipeptidase A